mmetsp:Transcript_29019/g.35373  ORF Transcript_29019/g.35373 Transcript_29019/m.35373 type:complete len:513 (+) Transcript_29019:117-1655(+)|eukprot:CAMPEP_0194355250 /NCGR_PEP_ID=MMETSP0174-20130528/3189_1 /TAXON_ID=216777 /ORGANISM="Proboscia alata, Strain PI-D3" /LENGTH=512 /DNA_ID=CAMNT_0039124461 /DNA_START=95 /DNA_END=1633 /DNA_ORIENTATION=-
MTEVVSSTSPDHSIGKIDEDDESNKSVDYSPGIGIFGRYPLISLAVFAILGLGVGIGLSYWDPDTASAQDSKDILIRWLGLLGDIFVRALKCIVIPLVFFNVVLATVEMVKMGKASSIGWITIGVYAATTLLAAIFGVLSTLMFAGQYSEKTFPEAAAPIIKLGCSDGTFLSESTDGSLSCSNEGSDEFGIVDVSNYFATNSNPKPSISLSETIYTGVFHKLISSNIFASLASSDLLAVVFFAVVFGVALGRLSSKNKKSNLYEIMVECDEIFIQMIGWVIKLTPFAVFSLLVRRLGSDRNLGESFANIGYLFAATIVGMVMHMIITHLIIFPIVTKVNPVKYLSHLTPAMAMAFASSSSAATLPVTMKCVESTGRVPNNIAKFVLPLGATINMDGTAIYIPAACIWMAMLNGITPNAAQYIVLIILGTVGSAGAAPVPSASLVLIITAYNTVFNQSGVPEGFAFILAIDWLVDSFRTMLNVMGDSVVSVVVTHFADLQTTKDLKGKEESQA